MAGRLQRGAKHRPAGPSLAIPIDPNSRVAFAADRETRIVGESSLRARIHPYGGERVELRFPSSGDLNRDVKGKATLSFWIKAVNENVPAWQHANPVITLSGPPAKSVRLEPRKDVLGTPPYNEAREGWIHVTIPLRGDASWKRDGGEIETLDALSIGFDSWGTPPLRIWIDGLAVR